MNEIRFYHLERQNLDHALPKLLSKALESGHRVIVKTPNTQETDRLNAHLWTYDPDSFLPHGTEKDGFSADQPVWITPGDENPNNADVIILTHGEECPQEHDFIIVCDIFDGTHPETLSAARLRWKKLKDTEAKLSYWQQSPHGGWEQKA